MLSRQVKKEDTLFPVCRPWLKNIVCTSSLLYECTHRKIRSPFGATIFSSSNFAYTTFLARLLVFFLFFFVFFGARLFLASLLWHDSFSDLLKSTHEQSILGTTFLARNEKACQEKSCQNSRAKKSRAKKSCAKNTFVLWPFQFQQEKKTNSGYKHFHFILDVSYVAAYIIRSDG